METIANAGSLSPWTPGVFSLIVYGVAVMALTGILLLASSWLGERKPSTEKLRAYESGVIPTGSARLRYPIPFFRVAIFFLLFDVEGAFIFSWAVALRPLGWLGWLEISFFILILLAGLVYIWRKGGLAWGPAAHRR